MTYNRLAGLGKEVIKIRVIQLFQGSMFLSEAVDVQGNPAGLRSWPSSGFSFETETHDHHAQGDGLILLQPVPFMWCKRGKVQASILTVATVPQRRSQSNTHGIKKENENTLLPLFSALMGDGMRIQCV